MCAEMTRQRAEEFGAARNSSATLLGSSPFECQLPRSQMWCRRGEGRYYESHLALCTVKGAAGLHEPSLAQVFHWHCGSPDLIGLSLDRC